MTVLSEGAQLGGVGQLVSLALAKVSPRGISVALEPQLN